MTDDEVLATARRLIKSVWALELLLLLRQNPRPWKLDELVRELRSSEMAVGDALASLQASGLVEASADQLYRYHPASGDLDRIAGRIQAIYATKPLAVAKAIMTASNDKLRIFSDAFRLKDS